MRSYDMNLEKELSIIDRWKNARLKDQDPLLSNLTIREESLKTKLREALASIGVFPSPNNGKTVNLQTLMELAIKKKEALSTVLDIPNLIDELEQITISRELINKKINLINAIAETCSSESKFNHDMQVFKDTLEYSLEPSVMFSETVTAEERHEIEAYLKLVNIFLESYKNRNFSSILKDENISISDALEGLHTLFAGELSNGKYAENLTTLIDFHAKHRLENLFQGEDRPGLAALLKFRTEGQGVAGYTSKPLQRLQSYQLLTSAIVNTLKETKALRPDSLSESSATDDWRAESASLEEQLNIAQKIAICSKELTHFTEQGLGLLKIRLLVEAEMEQVKRLPRAKKATAILRNILELHVHHPLDTVRSDKKAYIDIYLSLVLKHGYPDLFEFNDNNQFKINNKLPDKTHDNIHSALGLSDDQAPFSLHPDQFNVQILQDLYKNTHNPLWLVLKSTAPVSEKYPAIEKVNTYKQLAELFIQKPGKNPQQVLNTPNKPTDVFNLAEAADALAQDDPACKLIVNEYFGSKSPIGQYMTHAKTAAPEKLDTLLKKIDRYVIDEDKHISTRNIYQSSHSIRRASLDSIHLEDKQVPKAEGMAQDPLLTSAIKARVEHELSPGKKDKDRQLLALGAILSSTATTPNDIDRKKYADSYLKALLTAGFESLFMLKTDTQGNQHLQVNIPVTIPTSFTQESNSSNISKYEMINRALGLIVDVGTDVIVDGIASQDTLDPANFDRTYLEKLYALDNNPLWLALLSIKPIGEDFSTQQKLDTETKLAKTLGPELKKMKRHEKITTVSDKESQMNTNTYQKATVKPTIELEQEVLAYNLEKELQALATWKKTQLELQDTRLKSHKHLNPEYVKQEKRLIASIAATGEMEAKFNYDLQMLKVLLEDCLADTTLERPLTTAERADIEKYLDVLKPFLNSYSQRNFFTVINSDRTSTTEAMKALHDRFGEGKARFARQYSQLLSSLIGQAAEHRLEHIPEGPGRESLAKKFAVATEGAGLGSLTIKPLQQSEASLMFSLEYLNTLNQIDGSSRVKSSERLKLAEDMVNQHKNIAKTIGQDRGRERVVSLVKDKITQLKPYSEEERKIVLLGELLALQLNTPLENSTEDINTENNGDLKHEIEQKRTKSGYFDRYAGELLAYTYPKIFKFVQNEFKQYGEIEVKENLDDNQYHAIQAALDLDKTEDKFLLSPSQFNVEKLQKLHEKDKNPLWLVLKSTVPVSDTYSAADKINTSIQLATLFLKEPDKKVAHRPKHAEKYRRIYNLAHASQALAERYPECKTMVKEAFGPASEVGKYLSKQFKKHHGLLGSVTTRELKTVTSLLSAIDKYPAQKVERGTISLPYHPHTLPPGLSEDSIRKLDPMLKEIDEQVRYDLFLNQKESDRPALALKAIMTETLKDRNPEDANRSEKYLKMLLARGFPSIFMARISNNGDLILRLTLPVSDPNYEKINVALGFPMTATGLTTLTNNNEDVEKLDPSRFDATILQSLYNQPDHNPLWLLLRSSIPVSKTFSTEEKIQTYIDLAERMKDMALFGQDKINTIVQAAYNLAKERHEWEAHVKQIFEHKNTGSSHPLDPTSYKPKDINQQLAQLTIRDLGIFFKTHFQDTNSKGIKKIIETINHCSTMIDQVQALSIINDKMIEIGTKLQHRKQSNIKCKFFFMEGRDESAQALYDTLASRARAFERIGPDGKGIDQLKQCIEGPSTQSKPRHR